MVSCKVDQKKIRELVIKIYCPPMVLSFGPIAQGRLKTCLRIGSMRFDSRFVKYDVFKNINIFPTARTVYDRQYSP